tara:strand:+ start:294 stop:575 length:282 start_codon:yes stop_codon:yes gene_type:complete
MRHVLYKQGVCGDLTREATRGFGQVAALYERNGIDMVVTSIREGNHSAWSLHYIGRAFDLRVTDIDVTQIREVLGPEWDVVDEATHIHCELDP